MGAKQFKVFKTSQSHWTPMKSFLQLSSSHSDKHCFGPRAFVFSFSPESTTTIDTITHPFTMSSTAAQLIITPPIPTSENNFDGGWISHRDERVAYRLPRELSALEHWCE